MIVKKQISQKKIEAAARAICLSMFGSAAVHGEARCCQIGGTEGCCLKTIIPMAKEALEAAQNEIH